MLQVASMGSLAAHGLICLRKHASVCGHELLHKQVATLGGGGGGGGTQIPKLHLTAFAGSVVIGTAE